MFRLQDILALAAFLLVAYRLAIRKRSQYPLPPGPKGLPIVGNVYDLPPKFQWVAYRDIGRQYNSDIISLNLAGTSVIVVNSVKVAKDLFEKRYKLYSDRPSLTMVTELIGFKWNYGFREYGNEWKKSSSLLHREMSPSSISTYHKPYVAEATRSLLYQLLVNPDEFVSHLRHTAGKTILAVAYGIDVKDSNDYYVGIAEKAVHAVAIAGNAGSYLVDVFPILQHIPAWFPGAGFKRQAREWRKSVDAMPVVTLDYVKKAMADGSSLKTSMALRNLQEMQDDRTWTTEKESRLAGVLGATYTGGADTTVSALLTFILAMAKYPEVQKKAQRAVDAVTGGQDRLPEFSDEQQIPYIEALVKEVLRWQPVAPLAIPHFIKTEDVYEGYYIPANSVVIGNAWAMLQDEATYGPDTDVFRPERFMTRDGSNTLDPSVPHPEVAFGFGRRICPGKNLAQASLWHAIISIIACFDIAPKGKDELDGGYTSGLVSHPEPFICSIKPRSREVETLIRENVRLVQ